MNLSGLPVFVSQQLPHRGTKPGPMKLSPFVNVSDEFRVKTDAWLREFFGDQQHPQPCLVHAYRGYGMWMVSPQFAEELRRDPRIRDACESSRGRG